MGKFEKLKAGFEYAEHVKLVFDAVSAIASWNVTKVVLSRFTHLPPDVVSALAWAVATVILGVLLVVFRKKPVPQGTSSPGNLAALQTAPIDFDPQQYYESSYLSPLYPETEQNFRRIAEQHQPNDREGFYVKLLTVGSFAYFYDTIWWAIFRSQLLALEELVRHGGTLPLAKVRTFYDKAAEEFPAQYANRSLDVWLKYPEQQGLLSRNSTTDVVQITPRGRDFLRYLSHWGRRTSDRLL